MVSTFDNKGLTLENLASIIADLTTGMKSIYGADINVDSNSPDGQMINLYAQSVIDQLELLQQTVQSFSIAGAYGTVLDSRMELIGIQRKQGTFTQTPVQIVTSQSVILTGQDALAANPNAVVFTVADANGNQYQLLTTQTPGAGTNTYTFQAVNIGAVQVASGTITSIVTSQVGVVSCNNPSATGTVTGVNEETDAQLKVRASQSFALASTGPADAIQAAITAYPDVIDALVIENASGVTDAFGTNPHTIWTIVRGGTPVEIANAIYAKKAPGCGMRGGQSYVVTRPNGLTFTALWDTAVAQDLFITLHLAPISGSGSFNTTLDAAALASALSYRINQLANIGQIIVAMQAIEPTAYLTNIGVAITAGPYFNSVSPTLGLNYFTVTPVNIVFT